MPHSRKLSASNHFIAGCTFITTNFIQLQLLVFNANLDNIWIHFPVDNIGNYRNSGNACNCYYNDGPSWHISMLCFYNLPVLVKIRSRGWIGTAFRMLAMLTSPRIITLTFVRSNINVATLVNSFLSQLKRQSKHLPVYNDAFPIICTKRTT